MRSMSNQQKTFWHRRINVYGREGDLATDLFFFFVSEDHLEKLDEIGGL